MGEEDETLQFGVQRPPRVSRAPRVSPHFLNGVTSTHSACAGAAESLHTNMHTHTYTHTPRPELSSGVAAPRACVRVYNVRVLVPPNIYIHAYINVVFRLARAR